MYPARDLWWGLCKPLVLEAPITIGPPGGGRGTGLSYGELLRVHRAKTQGTYVAAQMAVVGF